MELQSRSAAYPTLLQEQAPKHPLLCIPALELNIEHTPVRIRRILDARESTGVTAIICSILSVFFLEILELIVVDISCPSVNTSAVINATEPDAVATLHAVGSFNCTAAPDR